jgi:hypothetical protein
MKSPVGIASMIISLANSTGWSEQYLLWELPMSRAIIYNECIAYQNGAELMPTELAMANEFANMQRELSNGNRIPLRAG